MFDTVLFPTDLSSHAQDELECLTSFPHVKTIHLVHVIKPFPIQSIEKLIRTQWEKYLSGARKYLMALNPHVAVTMKVMVGKDIAGTILSAASETGADLIVISGYAKNYRAGIFLGRIPAVILCRISKTDVLVMPNRLIDTFGGATHPKFCRNIFATVLCPTGFSESSKKAIACAGELPGVREIILLHVRDEGVDAVPDPEVRLEAMRTSLARNNIRVRVLIRDGDTSRTIARVAEEEDVSLVWMSMEGRGCLHAFLSGSIIEESLSLVERPLMVIRSME